MSGKATAPTAAPWFTAAEQAALRDFWAVYAAHYDEIAAGTMAVASSHPELAPLVRSMPREHLEAENRKSRERLERAIGGAWGAFEANLREQGARYCEAGISFRGWYDITRAYVRDLVPHIVRAYANEPVRLGSALVVMHEFLDRTMCVIAESYLDAKESALRQRERDLATTLDSIGDAVISTDASGRVTRINPIAQSLTGWDAAEARGRPLTEVFRIENEDTGRPVSSPVERVLREGVVVGLANHTALVARDGRRIAIADSAAPIRDADGTVRGVVLVFRDTTEQRAAQRALQLSEAQLALVHDGASDVLFLLAVEPQDHFRFVSVNQAFLNVTGLAREQIVGKPVEEVLPPTSHALVIGKYREAIERRTQVQWEEVAVFPAGKRVGEATVSPVFDEQGRPTHIVGTVHDVSAARAAEEALRESEERYRQIVETTAEGVWAYDASLTTVFASRRMAEMLGYSVGEMIGRPGSAFLDPDSRAAAAASVDKTRSGVGARIEYRFKKKDGSILWASVAVTPRADATGQFAGSVALVTDITEQRHMEEIRQRSEAAKEEARRAQEANRLKSEFLANMSHELRTPLNGIIGFAELMHDGKVGPVSADHKEYLGDILTSARHLLQLINDVLDLAKVESGKMEFRPERVELTKLIGEVRDVLRTMASKKRIELKTEVSAELREVVLDPAKLKQVLYNYLSNALKFTPDEGRVTVRVRAEGEESLRLEVEDTGIGVRPEDLNRLFVEFQQLDASAAKKYQGTGLGLVLTRRIVEAQGGRVDVRSTLRAGSVFSAILPRTAMPAAVPSPRADPTPVARARAGASTVLVIEDDAKDQAWLVETLIGAGYNVETATTGAEAMARIQARAFDAVTLDLLLPDMSGWEVLRKLRSGGANRDTPAIVVTVVAEKGAGAGFAIHDFLPKPVKADELIAALKRAGVPPHGGTVLIIDDDPQSLKLLNSALHACGYRTVCRTDGGAGLEAAAKEAPSAVVLDLLMPEMDGFEFLRRFRRTASGRRTPVIVWTVKDLTAKERVRLQSSAQAVVLKGEGSTANLLAEIEAYVKPEGAGGGRGW